MEESKGQSPEPGEIESDVRTNRSLEREPRSREAKTENATQRRHELGQSSEYPVRTGVEVCRFYLKTGRCRYGGNCKFNHPPRRNQMNNEMVQTSSYPVLPQLPEGDQMIHGMEQTSPPVPLSVQDCEQYLKNGRCSNGSNCRYNHPPNRVAPVRSKTVIRRNCKFFRSGACKHGSDCLYRHSMDSTPTTQATTESSSMAANRASESDPGERLQDPSVLAGSKRMRIEQETFERRRIEDEKLFQERRERQNSLRRQAQENMQRQNTERSPRRETEETVEERRLKRQEENLQRQEEADMERQTREAGQKTQEQLRRDTERAEARSRLDQMKPTVPSDNLDQVRESLRDIGIKRKEGDGF